MFKALLTRESDGRTYRPRYHTSRNGILEELQATGLQVAWVAQWNDSRSFSASCRDADGRPYTVNAEWKD